MLRMGLAEGLGSTVRYAAVRGFVEAKRCPFKRGEKGGERMYLLSNMAIFGIDSLNFRWVDQPRWKLVGANHPPPCCESLLVI